MKTVLGLVGLCLMLGLMASVSMADIVDTDIVRESYTDASINGQVMLMKAGWEKQIVTIKINTVTNTIVTE